MSTIQQANAREVEHLECETKKAIFPGSVILEINYNWSKSYLDLFPEGPEKEYCQQTGANGI
ncbi:hypothetical protein [Fluviicola sp.]|jgi:hypothetical protein|uniref:hypothetical protein n=1 Tax=Fluviicola sp. TaxID=1917219 RepID=UPI00282E21FE|nr:hypothetical protein [Fluviicola sp.]MDR0801383.1 hypothetical protein [Fluviicola sp.]